MPFEIPDNWTWIRVSSICKTIGGYAFKSSQFTNTGIRVIRISDFDETGIKNKDIKRYKFTDKLKDYQIMLNDILMCMTGGTVGKAVLITQIDEPMYINQRVALFRSDFINNEYLYCVLVSLYVREIIKSSKTSTNDNISMDLLNNILLPLPPENEQSRIIRAISNYEPLLNKYADLEFKLSKLESSFEEKVKASILQYAIEGKLVKQDPADEPASVLLERIKAEKEKLIKEGKIKRDKKESFIYQSDDKNYYEKLELTLKDVCSYGNTCIKQPKSIFELSLIELDQIISGDSTCPAGVLIKENKITSSRTYFEKGMILYSKLRPYLDKVILADKNGICSSELVPFWSYIPVNWLLLYLHSPLFIQRVNGDSFGVKMPRVKTSTFLNSKIILFSEAKMLKTIIKVRKLFCLFYR